MIRNITLLLIWIWISGCVTGGDDKAERINVVVPEDGEEEVVVMNFDPPPKLNPLPAGWKHETFMRHEPMIITFAEKIGIDAIRLDTRDTGSMLYRYVDIPLVDYPYLNWRWLVEQPIASKIDELTRDGDDHPARIFMSFVNEDGNQRSFELIWGNDVKPKTIFRIDDFPHYVMRNNQDGIGVWHNEKINLSEIYEKVFEETAVGTRVTDVALMADSDNTDGVSTAYFAEIKMTSD